MFDSKSSTRFPSQFTLIILLLTLVAPLLKSEEVRAQETDAAYFLRIGYIPDQFPGDIATLAVSLEQIDSSLQLKSYLPPDPMQNRYSPP